MKTLLVIDMLRDFMEKDGALYCGDDARKIIPFVRQTIEQYHREKQLVIFIQDSHRPDDLEFRMFPPHSIRGSEGAQTIAELPVERTDVFIEKTRYSAFFGTDLGRILETQRATEIQVVGVCTSICVMDTVGDLRNRDYPVVVDRNSVADFDPDAHEFSLRRMEKIYGVRIV